MNERENFNAYVHGEDAEWIPDIDVCECYFGPSIMEDPTGQYYAYLEENGPEAAASFRPKDCFGVQWKIDEHGPMPDPEFILLKDVAQWRDVVTFPETEGYDWDAACEIDQMWLEPDKAVSFFLLGPFLQLVDSMGHANAFLALITDPEEVSAYLSTWTDFIIKIIEETFSRVQVDHFVLADDMASAMNTFISLDTYRELFKPLHKRLFDAVKRVSPRTYLDFHLCGHGESFIDDIVETGPQAWQPAQVMNDVKAIQERYHGKLDIIGAWDNIKLLNDDSLSEEDLRASVRDVIDTYAADGAHYLFYEVDLPGSDPVVNQRREIVLDEAKRYGRAYLQAHRTPVAAAQVG